MSQLEDQLKEARAAPTKLIVSDGVFSMDGSITPLKYNNNMQHLCALYPVPRYFHAVILGRCVHWLSKRELWSS